MSSAAAALLLFAKREVYAKYYGGSKEGVITFTKGTIKGSMRIGERFIKI